METTAATSLCSLMKRSAELNAPQLSAGILGAHEDEVPAGTPAGRID